MGSKVELRDLIEADAPVIAAAFRSIGWNKPETQYRSYLEEARQGARDVIVALVDGIFAGYATIVWASHYLPFKQAGIPEISDLNVLPDFRRRGIAAAIMDKAEARIRRRGTIAGLGVGLYSDYGAAQRMYVLRGYVPDANGITAAGTPVYGGQAVVADDDLVLWFTKNLD